MGDMTGKIIPHKAQILIARRNMPRSMIANNQQRRSAAGLKGLEMQVHPPLIARGPLKV
jgi:hypothetical protein